MLKNYFFKKCLYIYFLENTDLRLFPGKIYFFSKFKHSILIINNIIYYEALWFD